MDGDDTFCARACSSLRFGGRLGGRRVGIGGVVPANFGGVGVGTAATAEGLEFLRTLPLPAVSGLFLPFDPFGTDGGRAELGENSGFTLVITVGAAGAAGA